MINIGIKQWINYKPSVGVEALHMIGLPGTGKSNMSTSLYNKCLNRGEFLIMPGDRFCEWRHYPFHPNFQTKIKILIPENVDIHYHNFKQNGWFEETNYDKLDILTYLDEKTRLLVIYDQHIPVPERSLLWVKVLEQLINRIEYLDLAMGLLFHEAGILFPEYASGNQWRAVKKFSELFVETRKGLVRTLLISQLDTEIESTIRKKCLYACIRKAKLSRSVGWPKPLIKAAPFTKLNEYHWCWGGLYNRKNTITKFQEKKNIFKMIPRVSIIKGESVTIARKNLPDEQIECPHCEYTWIPRTNFPKRCPKCQRYL